jgi:hypothetical protein
MTPPDDITDEAAACELFGCMPQPEIDEADADAKNRGHAGIVIVCQRCGKLV